MSPQTANPGVPPPILRYRNDLFKDRACANPRKTHIKVGKPVHVLAVVLCGSVACVGLCTRGHYASTSAAYVSKQLGKGGAVRVGVFSPSWVASHGSAPLSGISEMSSLPIHHIAFHILNPVIVFICSQTHGRRVVSIGVLAKAKWYTACNDLNLLIELRQ
eukprot:6093913-Amphidinium_carterae.2